MAEIFMNFCWERFRTAPVVGILRGMAPDRLAALVDAVMTAGLTTLEITMNSPDAAAQIRRARELSKGILNIGAGTVTTLALLEEAVSAGASFVVTPCLHRQVILACVARGLPVFPGALSPTEVLTAMEWGAGMVKVFPAEQWGPAYIRRLNTVLPDVKLMPTGGVDLETLPAYRAAGAAGFGVGSPMFDRARIDAGDWEWVSGRCKAFLAAALGKSQPQADAR